MNVAERLHALRELMRSNHFDAYLVPSDDCHQSEYVGEHFKARAFITGFTGSSGTAVITLEKAGLWTDGRYFLQAEEQLKGSGITLYKTGEPQTPSIEAFLLKEMKAGGTLGFDGKVVASGKGKVLEKTLLSISANIDYTKDLISQIWKNRPPLSEEPAFFLSEQYSGESTASKLLRVRSAMKKSSADTHILGALDDINWITNLRGNDIAYFPMVLSYAILTMENMWLYIDEKKLSPQITSSLANNNITIRPYHAVYDDITKLDRNTTVLLDPARLNYALYNSLPEGIKIIEEDNPAVLMKAKKNETELKNIINAHIKDGVAVTRFMYWLKQKAGQEEITEISAAEKLDSFRRKQDGYLWQSFEPICGFAEHGAIVHYSATEETNIPVTTGSFLLADTGGGYYEGSTDITRTYALGDVTKEMKMDFTTVLLGSLHLARAVFPYGTQGFSLDVLARQPAWERGLNYNHGTGHGVGYLLNIHEAPASFHYKLRGHEKYFLEEGMVVTNEPGLYIAGKYGIRIENEMIIRKGTENEYGQFLYFEPITYVPIDLDAVCTDMMSDTDKQQLNAYHRQVYELISPHLTEDEKSWLLHYTRPI